MSDYVMRWWTDEQVITGASGNAVARSGVGFTCARCGARNFQGSPIGLPDWTEHAALKGEVQRLRAEVERLKANP